MTVGLVIRLSLWASVRSGLVNLSATISFVPLVTGLHHSLSSSTLGYLSASLSGRMWRDSATQGCPLPNVSCPVFLRFHTPICGGWRGRSSNYSQQEDLSFEFPAKRRANGKIWMGVKHPSGLALCGPLSGTLFFSLEPSIGNSDFSKLENLVITARCPASPVSTAASLVHSPTWSDQREDFLRQIGMHGQGNGNGTVGGVFPLEIFGPILVYVLLAHKGWRLSHLHLDELDLDDAVR